ncbi:MAG: SAM-dependent methyltransferase [Chitinophagales bacterium]
MSGILYLIPTVLSAESPFVIPAYVHTISNALTCFFVENERTARRYLRATGYTGGLDEDVIFPVDADTDHMVLGKYIEILRSGKDAGLMSEAGVPAVADPGHVLVRRAHDAGIRVVPLTGPSSILLALMASGMNGQQFTFRGYIPVKQPERKNAIREMDAQALKGITQIWIETPYRNETLLEELLSACSPQCRLCVAIDLTGPGERIISKAVADWKKNKITIGKVPAIFLLGM